MPVQETHNALGWEHEIYHLQRSVIGEIEIVAYVAEGMHPGEALARLLESQFRRLSKREQATMALRATALRVRREMEHHPTEPSSVTASMES
jgi:hypothetical protein